MEINVVRQPLLVALVTLLLLAAGVVVCGGAETVTAGPASLLEDYVRQMQVEWPGATKMVCGVLILASGLSLGRMTTRYDLYSVHTYLAIPLYGLLVGILSFRPDYAVQYLSVSLFVFSMNGFYACFRSGTYGFSEIFRGAFALGLIPLVSMPSVAFALLVPLAVVVLKRSVREFLVAAFGYVFPFFTICYLNWAAGGPFSAPFVALRDAFVSGPGLSVAGIDPLMFAAVGTVAFLILCAALCYYLDLYAAGSKSRSILLFNLLLFVVTGGLFLLPCATPATGIFMAVPAAVVLPLLFVRLSRWATLLIYLGLLFLCFARICL